MEKYKIGYLVKVNICFKDHFGILIEMEEENDVLKLMGHMRIAKIFTDDGQLKYVYVCELKN